MSQLSVLWLLAPRRLLHNWALHAILLLGWVTAIAMTAAIPMFVDAVNQRLLRNELGAIANSRRPAFGFLFLALDRASTSVQPGGDPQRRLEYESLSPFMERDFAGAIGLPAAVRMHYVRSDLFQLFPTGPGTYGRGDEALDRLSLGFISDLERQARLTEGRMPAAPDDPAQPVEVLVHLDKANALGLQVGEIYVLYRAANPDPQTGERGFALPVRVAGIWTAAEPASDFWYISASVFAEALLTTPNAYGAISERIPRPFYETAWYTALDGGSVRADRAADLLRRINLAVTQVQRRMSGAHLTLSPENALLRYQRDVAAQSTLLLVLGLPVMGLTLLFVTVTASSLVERQQMEIATLRSRGGSGTQILGTYLAEGLLLSGLALALGLPAGWQAARLMGRAASLLAGDGDSAIGLGLDPRLTPSSLLYAAGAMALLNAATLLPAFRYSRLTVIRAERRLSRTPPSTSPLPITLDLLAGAACAYGWYLLRGEGRFGLPSLFQGVDLWNNPLLFLTPCLFLWSGTRLALRLLPPLMGMLESLAQLLPGLSLWLAMRNLARLASQYSPLLTLLLFTTGLGAFVVAVTRTLDDNLVDRALYEVGSSIAVIENAKRFNTAQSDAAGTNPGTTGWSIPPFDLHRDLEGVRAAARVGRFPASVTLGAGNHAIQLYGIDRTDWPQTGFFRPDFASVSLGALMNELALHPDGVLVSHSLLDEGGFALGDIIQVRGLVLGSGTPIPFRVVGHLDYFPTAFPPDDFFLVGNLEYVFSQVGGPLPYHVWLRVDPEVSGADIQGALTERSIEVLQLEDARLRIAEWKAAPSRLGLFGFLALGYGITVLLSVVALAVQGALTLRRRRIQLGVLLALGLRQRQASASLALEQFFITGLGIGLGALLGYATSQIFVPYLQGGLTAADRVPPYVVRIAWSEVLVSSSILTVAALGVTLVLGLVIARSRIIEALKIGELQG